MSKYKRQLIKGTNWALAGLMGLLGFSACDKFGPLEYGTPNADFIVSGKVMDPEGTSLPGIRIVVQDVDYHQRATSVYTPDQSVITESLKDTLYTQSDGSFKYKFNGFPTNDTIRIKMKFEDILAKPRYKSDSTNVNFSSDDLKGGKGWYNGKTEKNIVVTLKKKEDEAN